MTPGWGRRGPRGRLVLQGTHGTHPSTLSPQASWARQSDTGVGAGQRQGWGEATVRHVVLHPRGGWSERLDHKDSEER